MLINYYFIGLFKGIYRALQFAGKSSGSHDVLNNDWLNVGNTLLMNKPSLQVNDQDLSVIMNIKGRVMQLF